MPDSEHFFFVHALFRNARRQTLSLLMVEFPVEFFFN